MPEISGHLLAATPTCHWLEYVDWADVLLQEPCASRAAARSCPIVLAPEWCGTKRR